MTDVRTSAKRSNKRGKLTIAVPLLRFVGAIISCRMFQSLSSFDVSVGSAAFMNRACMSLMALQPISYEALDPDAAIALWCCLLSETGLSWRMRLLCFIPAYVLVPL
jgi:hypothetical protein